MMRRSLTLTAALTAAATSGCVVAAVGAVELAS